MLYEQYKDAVKLCIRKRIHRTHSEGKIDTQYEAIRRIGGANSILDIGCGSGDLLVKLRAIGFRGRLKGIDKYDIINEGIESSKRNNLDIEFEQIDIEEQAESGNWDVGVMVSILCLTPGFRDVIKRYSKICKRMIIVDVGPGAYPRLNKEIPNKIEEIFNVKLTTLGIGFNIQDMISELMKYYEDISMEKLDDTFRFTNADAVAEYFSTNGIGAWLPELSKSKWEEILTYVRSVAQKEIETNGVWLEPKPYYVVTAEKPAQTMLPYVTYSHLCNGNSKKYLSSS